MERRIEPEPPLARELRAHPDIGNQELVFEHLALERQSHQATAGRARAIAAHQPVAAQAIRTSGCLDRNKNAIVVAVETYHLVAPAQIDLWTLRHAFDQEFLDVVLLQIDEGRHLVPALWEQVELVDLRRALEHLALLPDHALGQHGLCNAEPIENLKRALGEADRTAALANAVSIIQQHGAYAALCKVQGESQPDRPRADDDDRVMLRITSVLIGRAPIAILEARRSRSHEMASGPSTPISARSGRRSLSKSRKYSSI